jgi:hypothetical protein
MLAQPPAIVCDHDSPPRSSRIQVVDVASGAIRPVAHADWLLLASDHAPWQDSLLVEKHRRPPFETPEHAPHAHHVVIRLGSSSILEYGIAGERPRRQRVTPDDVHLSSAGVPMWYRLQEPSEILILALAPNPNEMGFPDTACVVHRLSQSEYRPLFETVWGSQAFRIDWPADTDQVCSRAVPPRTNAPGPVKLRQADRDRANVTYDQFGLAIRA